MTYEHAIQAGWQKIASAPYDQVVLLRGRSGYIVPHDKFMINGYRIQDWHGGDWNDVTGTPLSDRGWIPDHWMPLPLDV